MSLTRREALAGAVCSAIGVPAYVPKRTPNVLFIHTDQQFAGTVAAHGCPYVRTPNMDRLAAQGVSFHESYSADPVCCPARSAWYTGRPPSENGVVRNDTFPLEASMPDLGQWFSGRGYDSLYAGKWHIPGRPHDRSFRLLTQQHGIGEQDDISNARAVREFLRSRRPSDGPFFLSLGLLQPHDICYWVFAHTERLEAPIYPDVMPELPPIWHNLRFDEREPETFRKSWRNGAVWQHMSQWDEWQWRYYRWSYYRHVEMVDGAIGMVLDALEETKRDRDTVVVFTSDHGDGMGAHMLWQKMYFYEEVVRVPLVVSWRGHTPAGADDREHLVSGLDIAPTLCDYAGIEPMPQQRGRSLKPLVERRKVEWRDYLVSEAFTTGRMVRTATHKFIKYHGDATEQLFDMHSDRGEMQNLIGSGAADETADAMRRMLAGWEAHLVPSSAGRITDPAWNSPGSQAPSVRPSLPAT
ncbi:MAG: sulfatase-like hydrolase/transferase [Chthonomonadales bacterium]|nr:sulfatase-like hydrolase/transferase [Chthonomonadales bacterium]